MKPQNSVFPLELKRLSNQTELFSHATKARRHKEQTEKQLRVFVSSWQNAQIILSRYLSLKVGWGVVLLASALVLVGCGKPGNSANNFTNSIVTITSLNDNQPFQSDVLTNGYATDDVITAKLQCDFRAAEDDPTAPDGPSVFDTITFHTYHVGHQRSDGGANPSDFTAGLTLSVAPNSEAEVNVVIVRAFDKNRSPLEELRDDGEIFTTTTLTLYGQDGYGNDITVSASLAISFANFSDN